MRAARRGVRSRAGLKAADGDHLVPRPDSDGEGAGAAAQDRVGTIVKRLKGWNQAAPMDPDEGGGELPQRSTLNTFFRCSQFSRCSFAQFNPVRSCIFLCVPHFRQFTQSFALQWIPFAVPRGPSTQQTFGFCQLSLIRKTCLVTI